MSSHRNRSNCQTTRIQFVQWLMSVVFFLKRIVAKLAKWIWPLLKKLTHVLICYIAVPIANLAFMVVPFLHNLIPPVWAYSIWGSSLVIFAADSIYQWRKKQKKPEQSKPMDIFTRGFSWAVLVFFGSAFIVNYFDTGYTWYWAIAVSIAVICPIAWMNMSTFISAQKQYTAEQRKKESWFSVKMTAFYWLLKVVLKISSFLILPLQEKSRNFTSVLSRLLKKNYLKYFNIHFEAHQIVLSLVSIINIV